MVFWLPKVIPPFFIFYIPNLVCILNTTGEYNISILFFSKNLKDAENCINYIRKSNNIRRCKTELITNITGNTIFSIFNLNINGNIGRIKVICDFCEDTMTSTKMCMNN